MGFLGFGKNREDVIDLSGYYKKKQENLGKEEGVNSVSSSKLPQEESTDFLSNLAGASSQSSKAASNSSSDFVDLSGPLEDKRKRFAKRFMDMTNKIEDLNNQIYHLTQRIELLEKKSGVK